MADLERKRKQRRRLYFIVAASFVWAVLLLLWFVGYGARLPRFANALASHAWAIMSFLVVATLAFWILLWRQRGINRLSTILVIFKACSDILLIMLFAGLLFWNWSSTALIVVGIAVLLSYVARLIRSGAALVANDGGR